jgi:hypothetical protein
MKGYGFLIWLLGTVFPPSEQIAVWKEIGVQWVSIKVRDYINEYNRLVGSNALEDFLIACAEADIKVGTWHFVHTTNMAKQAQLISKDIKEFKLEHLMVDAEQNSRVYPGAYWKSFPRYRVIECARRYMDNLDLPDGFPVGLCSYRYPEVHREFPFQAFLDHPKMTMINPQVYWQYAHNPGYQVGKSLQQYRRLSQLPFNPIGASYEEHGWAPTAKDIAEFTEICQDYFDAYGFYRWGHAKKRKDWLAAMKVEVASDPSNGGGGVEPPPPHECVIPSGKLVSTINALRIRSGPGLGYAVVGYVTQKKPKVEILARRSPNPDIEWWRIGYKQWSAAKYGGKVYLQEA